MYMEERNGKYRFVERYTFMGKTSRVSVTMEKNTAASRKEASRLLHNMIAEKTSCGGTGKTFGQICDLYLKEQSAVVKLSTLSRNRSTLGVLRNLIGEDAPCDELTAGYIRQKLLEHTNNPVTLNEYQTRLRALFRWAASMEYIEDDSIARKLVRFPAESRRSRTAEKYLEMDELKEVLAAASEYDRPVINFLVVSGLRIGELIALTEADITEDYIEVNKTYDYLNDVTTSAKTNESNRLVHISPTIRSAIKAVNSTMKQIKLVTGQAEASVSLFVVSQYGERFSYRKFEARFSDLTEKTIGRRLTVHSLRHTCASLYASKGIPLETISRMLGHAHSAVTKDVYMHTTKDVKEADALLLDSVSFG